MKQNLTVIGAAALAIAFVEVSFKKLYYSALAEVDF